MKKINLASPIGIALTVAGVVVALSPNARSAIRKLMVKGTAGVMDAMEHAGGAASGAFSGVLSDKAMTWKRSTAEAAPLADAVPLMMEHDEPGSDAAENGQIPPSASTGSL